MKQHDRNNGYPVGRLSGYPDIRQTAEQEGYADEALYQQILAELAPGAEEYDKIVAEGKHPATKKRRTIPYYKYAAAACILLAVAGSILLLQQRGEEPEKQTTAQVEEKVNDNPGLLLAQETPTPPTKAEQAAPSKAEKEPAKATKTETPHASTTHSVEPSRPEPASESVLASNDGYTEAELQLALLEEIEDRMAQARLQEEYLHRAAIEEVYTHILENPDGPQLTL